MSDWEVLLESSEEQKVWREDPVDFVTFVESKEFQGHPTLSPNQYKEIHRLIGSDPKKLFDGRRVREAVWLWGKGCLARDTVITDVVTGERHTVQIWAKLKKPIHIRCYDELTGEIRIQKASPVFWKGRDKIYKVTVFGNGSMSKRCFYVTQEHKVYTPSGWCKIKDLKVGDKIYIDGTKVRQGKVKISEHQKRLIEKIRKDLKKLEEQPELLLVNHLNHVESLMLAEVKSIEYGKEDDYYDFTVPVYHNYFLDNGTLHHNSGKGTCSSLVSLYVVYVLLCMNDCHGYFNVAREDPLSIVNVATSGSQAQRFFERFVNRLQSNVWFRNFRMIKQGKCISEGSKYSMEEIVITGATVEFPQGIQVNSLHSQQEKWEGLTVIMFVADEMSGFVSDKGQYNADAIYRSLRTSTRELPYIGIITSFPRLDEECLAEDQVLEDVITKEVYPVKKWAKLRRPVIVETFDDRGEIIKIQTKVPFLKGMDDIYEITFDNRKRIKVGCGHRFLTEGGWRRADELEIGSEIYGYDNHRGCYKRKGEKPRWVWKECPYCKQLFESPYWCRKRFCSKVCANRYHNGFKKGKLRPKEVILKMSKSLKGRKSWNKGLTKETDERLKKISKKLSQKLKCRVIKEEWIEKSKETWRRKIENGWISPLKGRVQSEEYKEKRLRACRRKPTKLESYAQTILEKMYPGVFRYVGNFSCFIGGKNPDFVSMDKRLIVEVFGSYWHKRGDEEKRIKHFTKYGFRTLVIWDYEFRNIGGLRKKIKEWMESSYVFDGGISKHLTTRKIIGIKKLGRGKIYDLTVPKYHSYLLMGVMNHNSDFTYKKYVESMKDSTGELVGSKYKTWEIKPDRYFSGEYIDFVLNSRTGEVCKVPVEYRRVARDDPEGLKSRYMCLLGTGTGDFIQYPEYLDVIKEVAPVVNVEDEFVEIAGKTVLMKRIVDVKPDTYPRVIGLDAGHKHSESTLVMGYRRDTVIEGKPVTDIVIDCIIDWTPSMKKGITVDITNSQKMVEELWDLFNVTKVRMDHWNSAAISSYLMGRGITCEVKDANYSMYTKYRTVVYREGLFVARVVENTFNAEGDVVQRDRLEQLRLQSKILKSRGEQKPRVEYGRQDLVDAVVHVCDLLLDEMNVIGDESPVGVMVSFRGDVIGQVVEKEKKQFMFGKSSRVDVVKSDDDDWAVQI